ncbi:MAG: hypothetical protein K0B37_18025 [Bacteroidales bacterium]|nr:hypothetical protein [Bacteroidales bacterium]
MLNEIGADVPPEMLNKVKDKAKDLGHECVQNYYLYIYKDGQYGPKKFPASSIGGTKATRFRNKESYEANKIEIDDGWVVFRSPTHGGINIFDDFVPYRH